MKKLIIILFCLSMAFFSNCVKTHENPNYPNAIIDITIDLDRYPQLRTNGGYVYITSDIESRSRGIIVCRPADEILAYDRLPPNYPDACTDNEGNTTRLVVESPFVVDRCNNAFYNILNGSILIDEAHDMVPKFPTEGVPVYPLIQYHADFDGYLIHIYN